MVRSVLIVGLGDIGMGYDLGDIQSSERVLTHAHAFNIHDSFDLAGGVDLLKSKRILFEDYYGLPAYNKISVAMKALIPNVVVIATPVSTHLHTIVEIFSAGNPDVILCEKPLAYDIHDAEQIVKICLDNNCKLFVNYFRLAEPGVISIQEQIRDGRIGTPIKGVCWYSRGLYNSASHFLNLLHHLLGDTSTVKLIKIGRLWKNVDPEPDFEVVYAQGRVIFLAARSENFFHNSIELVSVTGRLSYEQGGAVIIWQRTAIDSKSSGYIRLSDKQEAITSDFNRIQWHVTDQLAKILIGESAHICSIEAAMKTQKILQTVSEML